MSRWWRWRALQNPVFRRPDLVLRGVKVGMEVVRAGRRSDRGEDRFDLELAGVFAANFGPLLAGALEQFAPVIEAICGWWVR